LIQLSKSSLLTHREIVSLIPHAGKMCLLDEVRQWDEKQIHCTARSHRDRENPLRANDSLSVLVGVEYAAQAMALHGGLLLRSKDTAAAERLPVGRLVSVRNLSCCVDRLDDIDEALEIHAQRIAGDDQNLLYAFSIQAIQKTLLEGRVSVLIS